MSIVSKLSLPRRGEVSFRWSEGQGTLVGQIANFLRGRFGLGTLPSIVREKFFGRFWIGHPGEGLSDGHEPDVRSERILDPRFC